MKLFREPLLHFFLIGAAIYLLYGYTGESVEQQADDKQVVITAGQIEWMQTAWQKRWNRLPTQQELDGLIEQYIRETVLYREALAMGLDKDDVVIRRRLAQKIEFLAEDLVALIPPTDEDLQAYFDEHRQRYQKPVAYTFTQVFFDPDKRGDATLDDAEKVKAALIASSDVEDDVGEFGDSFMLQNYYPENTRADIQKLFGAGFADSVTELASEQWHGPVLSGYGVHLVYVHNVRELPAPVFAEMRDRVVQDWETDKRQELNEQFYAGLRERYTVIVEEPMITEADVDDADVDSAKDDEVDASRGLTD
jgi:hypothetical protein